MYETVVNLDEGLSALAMIAWLVTGYRVARIAFRPDERRRRRSARIVLGLLGVDALLLAAKLGSVGLLWGSAGWSFAQNRVLVELPVLLAGVLAAFGLAAPRLWRVARQHDPGPDRGAAADPRLVVPVQAAAVAAVLAFWIVFVTRPVPPYWLPALVFGGLLVVVVTELWLRQRRRLARLTRPEARLPGPGRRILRAVGVLVALVAAAVGGLVVAAQASVLPDEYTMMSHVGTMANAAGMSHHGGHPQHSDGVDLTSLTGAVDGTPDRRFTLTAAPAAVQLASGETAEGWAFNGQLPGPELRMRQGELVEVTLVNALPDTGVTLHWHGVDVPNAQDGVAGLTQDAISPGGRHVYRFRAPDVGSYWYHSHQLSDEQVRKGLFGALVVLPPAAPVAAEPGDRMVVAHTWNTPAGKRKSFGTDPSMQRQAVAPGTPVRLRVLNTDNGTLSVTLAGTPFRVAAIDGGEVSGPTDLVDTVIRVAAGGRDDLTFTMQDHPVLLAGVGFDVGPALLLSPDGGGDPPPVRAGTEFDPLHYGNPTPTPFDATSPVDSDPAFVLDDGPRFFDGQFGFHTTINGASFPDTPMQMVREGDLVRNTFVNRSHSPHPMHLHGHHALVLSRDGVPASGSPWWVDTLEVRPGETYVIAFQADNPGLWMDHCHNLSHAATGMTMHLGYEGVTTPFVAGRGTANQPE